MALKLLREQIDHSELEILSEGEGSNKIFRIKGPFIVADQKNGNGRIYSKTILEKQVNLYKESKISTKRSVGELDHPKNPSINLDRISHIIESLEFEGNIGIGVAKLLDTPMGRIAKTLVNEGVKLGVSSRGLGSVNHNNYVNDDYKFITVDLVHEASGPGCYVDPILENKEYIIDGDSIIEASVSNLKKKLDRQGSKELAKNLKEFIKAIK